MKPVARAGLAGALLWATTLATAGCTDLGDLFLPYAPHPDAVEALLAAQTPMAHYDAALVLGCPADPGGVPSLCERCRVTSAVRQWRQGHIDGIVFSGGAAHSPDVEADVMGDLAVRRGVPADRVVREGRALTTWQNLRFSLPLLAARGWHDVLVISTADHLPRARRIARYWGLDDAHARYFACDRDLPVDDEPYLPPTATAPPTANGARR